MVVQSKLRVDVWDVCACAGIDNFTFGRMTCTEKGLHHIRCTTLIALQNLRHIAGTTYFAPPALQRVGCSAKLIC
eukprot:7911031-Pyramimonas_sp.AAC.1